jgi:lysine decarboxylase
MGLSDHRRLLATLSMADDKDTVDTLVDGIAAWRDQLTDPQPPRVDLPSPEDLQLETVMLPRDAFFGPVQTVDARDAVGRIAAEQLTPYPPGIPVVVPGERIDDAVVEYLRTGLDAGMNVPDAADSRLRTIRVVARD